MRNRETVLFPRNKGNLNINRQIQNNSGPLLRIFLLSNDY